MVVKETPQETAAAPAENDDALRKRLLSRIAVAGVAVVGLLGGLAIYDAMNRPDKSAMSPVALAPVESVAIEEKKAEEQVAAEEKNEATGTPAATESVPEKSETPVTPPVAEKSLPMAKPLTAPAAARPATAWPSAPIAAPVKPDATREIARTQPSHPVPAAAPTRPLSPVAQVAESARRFLVQVGVFSNHANAEELVAKLEQAGIPAHIESRVQVGPFASRVEADAARAKLKALGIDDGLLVRR